MRCRRSRRSQSACDERPGHGAPAALRATRRRTFAALAVPNYRRYFIGQATSLIGTWMQMAAQSWLVLTLTGSATALGLIVALQTLPVLLLGPYGGVIADRVDKRRLMVVLQSAMGLQALVLGVLTITGVVQLWEIGVLAVAARPQQRLRDPGAPGLRAARWSVPSTLRNAVSLNAVEVNVARAVGPAVAGVLIATVGLGDVLPHQRRELRRGRRFAAFDGALRTAPRHRRCRARPDSCARGFAMPRPRRRSPCRCS